MTKRKTKPEPTIPDIAAGIVNFERLIQAIKATERGDAVGEDGGSMASEVIELADAVLNFYEALDLCDGSTTDALEELKAALQIQHAGMGPMRNMGHH